MSGSEPLPAWADRQAAVVISLLEGVEQAVREGQPADRALQKRIKGNKRYGSRDRRLIGDAIFSWFRWHGAVGQLPLEAGVCAAWALEGREWPPALRALLRKNDLPEPGAPVSEDDPDARGSAVEQALGLSLAPLEEWLPEWWKNEAAYLGDYGELLQEHLNRPPTWLRVDKTEQPRLHEELLADGAEWAGEASPCAYAFTEAGKVRQWLRKEPEAMEIQDLSSQQVVRICAPKAGQVWWDACCGHGGKSLQLLDEADRSLDLTCTDRREPVLKELVTRGRRHGLGKVRRYALDLLAEDRILPNLPFDGILLDAPCTGSGTWARNPDGVWRTEASDVAQAARRQIRLLNSVVPALKSGGVLVYAVCSLTRQETTEVVRAFLEVHPEFSPEPFPHPLTGEPTDGRLVLRPKDTRADGMFAARFIKQ